VTKRVLHDDGWGKRGGVKRKGKSPSQIMRHDRAKREREKWHRKIRNVP